MRGQNMKLVPNFRDDSFWKATIWKIEVASPMYSPKIWNKEDCYCYLFLRVSITPKA